MKALIIGSGAREHALARKVAQSPKIKEIFVAPGNAGTAKIASNLNISSSDINGLLSVAKQHNIDITIVGPEIALSSGIVDLFQKEGLAIFGPTRLAAQLEWSKVFSKYLMEKYDIPCARGAAFSNHTEAKSYLAKQKMPVVIKADGLAAGKGVIIANSHDEANKAIADIMESKIFGAAGDKLLIEECLVGKEVSLLAFTDGSTVIPMVPACDYKRVFDNDLGPNTGGMGSYSPPGFFDACMINEITETVLKPTINAMKKEGIQYKGVLYAGLMLTEQGTKVLEYNARFGDPETQVIIPRLKTDIIDIIMAIVNNSLSTITIEWSEDPCIGVVMTSGGYPASYKTGYLIRGLNNLEKEIIVFHAGTRQNDSSEILTDGGRVLTVVATAKTVPEARNKVYENIAKIEFSGCHYRKDIALREVN